MRLPRRPLLLAPLAIFLALAPSCKKKDERLPGSGVQATKTRPVAPFTKLAVASNLEVVVTIGKDGPLELRGDDNLLEHVTSKVENGTLKLDVDTQTKTRMPLQVRLSTSRLERVSTSGAARVNVQGLKADALNVSAGGAGRVSAKGSATALTVNGKMATRFDFSELAVASAKVTLEGASQATMGYLEKLEVTLSGPSLLVYRGDPELKQAVNKPARLVRRDR